MLARRIHVVPLRIHISRRPINRHFTTGIQNGFMDLALALPLPPDWPTYTSAIILTTVAGRLLFTLPFSVWARRRQHRIEQFVLPALAEASHSIQRQERQSMIMEGVTGSKQELDTMYRARFKAAMSTKRKALLKQHHASPLVTMSISTLSQIPLFVAMSILFARIAQPPFSMILDTESFLTLTSLTHADPTSVLPVALGLITLANTESASWFLREQTRLAEENEARKIQELREQGKVALPSPQKIVRGVMRVLSVGRIVLGMMVPGTVIVYWVTSATFGLIQTWIFDYSDHRKLAAKQSGVTALLARASSKRPGPPRPVVPPARAANTKQARSV